MPVDSVNERIVVAAAIAHWDDLERRQQILLTCTADDFGDKPCAAMWRALEEMHRRHLGYDPRTLVEVSDGAVTLAEVADLIETNPDPPAALDYHLQRLKWQAARVRAVRGPLAALHELLSLPATPPEQVELVARELAQTLGGAGDRIVLAPRAVAASTIAEIDRRHKGQAIYPYGLEGFDLFEDGTPRVVPGAAPREITLVVGLSGSGKSAVAKAIGIRQAELGRRVLFCAWEMGHERDLEAMCCMRLGLSVTAARAGLLTDEQRRLLKQEVERFSDFITFATRPFAKERRRRWTNEEAIEKLQEAIVSTAADVVVCDLWKRMLRDTRPDDEEQALVYQQQICQETKCHLVALHQLTLKQVETRTDKRPTRDSIKGSGTYVEVPDTIIGVHRPGLVKRVMDDLLEAVFLKQRDAAVLNAVQFTWDGARRSISNGRSIDWDDEALDDEIDKGLKRGKYRGGRHDRGR